MISDRLRRCAEIIVDCLGANRPLPLAYLHCELTSTADVAEAMERTVLPAAARGSGAAEGGNVVSLAAHRALRGRAL